MLTKSCPVQVKALVTEGEDEGQFEALVAVFGNKDSYGDVIKPGAFEESLKEDYLGKGIPVPIYWSHQLNDPDMNIGWCLEVKETAEGLWVRGQLDLESPKAVTVYRLFKGARVTQFSFSYKATDYAWVRSDDPELGEYFELRKIKLYEVGPTPVGANQETELLAVKSAQQTAEHLALQVKAGKVLSSKNEEAIRAARDSLDGVLSAIDTDASKASGAGPAKDETPAGKSEEPSQTPPALLHEALGLELELSA